MYASALCSWLLSPFGSYSGTGADHSSEQTLGFRPAFVLVRDSTSGGDPWVIFDNTRDTDGTLNNLLFPNSTGAEVSSSVTKLEISDTGFTVKGTGTAHNKNGSTIIYMAFADTREAAFFKDVIKQRQSLYTCEPRLSGSSVPDTPTNNYAVLNPLDINSAGGMTLSEGNLKLTSTNSGSAFCAFSNFVLENGSWYSEVYINGQTGGYPNLGVADLSKSPTANEGIFAVKGVGYAADGNVYRDGGNVIDTVSSFAAGDIIGIAYDADNRKIYFSKNGTFQNSANPAAGSDGYTVNAPVQGYVFGAAVYSPSPLTFNFGQDSSFAGIHATANANADENGHGSFAYAPPSGFLALCSQNLPDVDIIDGSEYFNTVLWTGDNTTPRSLTNSGQFQPDFVWIKNRSNAYQHNLYDSVRGAGSAYALSSDGTAAEGGNSSTYGYLSSFNSTGFTVTQGTAGGGSAPNGNAYTNQTSSAYVAWNWLAGTAFSNDASATGVGTIDSSGQVNTKAGFSIVSYSGVGASAGATVSHGLNQAPELILPKNRGAVGSWHGYHSALGGTKGILLNSTNAASTDAGFWNNTNPTSSVFTVGTYNVFDNDYIAYCFHSVEGYSKVGSYTGNGNADGPFIYTGFRPAWIIIKNLASGENWQIHDSVRDPDNVVTQRLYANTSGADVTSTFMDFVSNGVKCRNYSGGFNSSGATFIYFAFAEQPFKFANAR